MNAKIKALQSAVAEAIKAGKIPVHSEMLETSRAWCEEAGFRPGDKLDDESRKEVAAIRATLRKAGFATTLAEYAAALLEAYHCGWSATEMAPSALVKAAGRIRAEAKGKLNKGEPVPSEFATDTDYSLAMLAYRETGKAAAEQEKAREAIAAWSKPDIDVFPAHIKTLVEFVKANADRISQEEVQAFIGTEGLAELIESVEKQAARA